MCFGGGGGSRATIMMPDTRAYDREFELQKAAIDAQMGNSMQAMQSELNSALRDQQTIREDILQAKTEEAENQDRLSEQAYRLSTLMGPPPPEKTAEAPEIGDRERGVNTRRGKSSLRIGRTATTSAAGTGLNIT